MTILTILLEPLYLFVQICGIGFFGHQGSKKQRTAKKLRETATVPHAFLREPLCFFV